MGRTGTRLRIPGGGWSGEGTDEEDGFRGFGEDWGAVLVFGSKWKMNRSEFIGARGLKDEKHFREDYQQTAVAVGLVEMTIPDKPKSSKQRYRRTALGEAVRAGFIRARL